MKSPNKMAIVGLVFSFFLPVLGLIFGSVGLSQSNSYFMTGRKTSLTAITISLYHLVIRLFLFAVYHLGI
ncbi:MAG: hypothetical protein IJX96_00620 [Clostridia bacterium]|nr:hypothetical protein [Clostridia bacterium]